MLLWPVVFAYTLLHTNGTTGPVLHWDPASAPYSLNNRGSADIGDNSDIDAVAASFDAWNAVSAFHYHTDCLTSLGVSSINPGNERNDGNSIVVWVENNWVYGNGTIAITFNWYDPNTGVIGESDLMSNGQDYTWTTGDTAVETDVQDFLTHEAGHYLGMGHSADTGATMYATGSLGETLKRSLNADDIAGVRAIYGTGNTGASGPPMACGSKSSSGCGCDLSRERSPASLWSIVLAVAAAGIAFFARRRRGFASLLVAAGVVGFAGSARATTMRDLALPELAHDADTVVNGTVESVETVTDGQTIRTVNRIVVHEVLAGRDYGTVLDVWTPGGNLPAGVAGPNGYRGLTTSGVPTFLPGDEVVVFGFRLAGDPANTIRVSNLAQGKMDVLRDANGTTRLTRDLSGVSRVIRAVDGRFEPAPPEDPMGALSLDALRTALRGTPTR